MKRALCIWIPHWPLQRLAAAREELRSRAVVLYQIQAQANARVVAYAPALADAATALWDADADRLAIRPGMPLAEATALASRAGALHLEVYDPLADRLALDELAQWCQRFSPTVGVEEADPPESLLADVTGLGPLAGDEGTLARQVVRAFHERSLQVRVAIADTLGAAWGAAHFAELAVSGEAVDHTMLAAALDVPLVIAAGETAAALAALPIEALRLPPAICTVLAELGLHRVEQVMALPRATLLSRFGPAVLDRLDQATGLAAEAIVARGVPAELEFEWLLEHPTGRQEMIEFVLAQLIARMCDTLARERRGVLQLQCRLEHEQGPATQWVVGLYRASASARHVEELARLKLEKIRLREPVAAVRLLVLALDQLEFEQQELFAAEPGHASGERESARALATLVDRLSNRLGSQAVLRPSLLAHAQPECACHYQPLAGNKTRARKKTARAASPSPEVPGDRPLELEPRPVALSAVSVAPEGPPMQFRLPDRDERVVRVWGPERIETGWWRHGCVRRDYYQVETARGSRFWLFRELNSGRWFLHGEFA